MGPEKPTVYSLCVMMMTMKGEVDDGEYEHYHVHDDEEDDIVVQEVQCQHDNAHHDDGHDAGHNKLEPDDNDDIMIMMMMLT